MVVRVGHKAPVVRVEGTIISRLRRPIRLGPSRGKTARSALHLTVKVASVHGIAVFPRRVRMGVISTTPRICFDDGMTMRHQHGGAPGETTRHTHAQPVAQSHTIGTAVKHSHTVRRSAPRWVSPLPIRVAQATSPRPLLSGHIAAQSIVPHPIFRAGSPHRWPGRANFA